MAKGIGRIRKLHSGRTAQKKLHPELLFKLPQRPAHGRLCQRQRRRGCANASQAGDI